jgi:hypothetical protein
MSLNERIDALLAVRGSLTASDQSFANSLCTQGRIKGALSEKQLVWLDRLTERARKPRDEIESVQVGNLAGVIALFETARKHLKWPAIVLGYGGDKLIRLTVAGAKAKHPGTVNVVDKGSKTWFGRIHTDGRFELSANEPTSEVIALLTRFAADPAGVAAEHGRLTGACCFCNTALTDERSTGVGYGPVCAKHYGLPWGAETRAKAMSSSALDGWTASYGSTQVATL